MKEQDDLLLEIRGLEKIYGETRALTGMDLEGRRGTIHTVFGENGSGKSTMVKVLSGVIGPDSGEIRFDGELVSKFEPRAMHRLGIVPVMQEMMVAPNRSALENIFLGFDNHLFLKRTVSRNRRPEVAWRALDRITNTEFDLDCLVGELPLAQQGLVVIARALLHNPRILILDEATAALDIKERESLFAGMHDFVAEGRLVIFISHRVDEVLEVSDHVTVLCNGMTVGTVQRKELGAGKLLEMVSAIPVSSEVHHA